MRKSDLIIILIFIAAICFFAVYNIVTVVDNTPDSSDFGQISTDPPTTELSEDELFVAFKNRTDPKFEITYRGYSEDTGFKILVVDEENIGFSFCDHFCLERLDGSKWSVLTPNGNKHPNHVLNESLSLALPSNKKPSTERTLEFSKVFLNPGEKLKSGHYRLTVFLCDRPFDIEFDLSISDAENDLDEGEGLKGNEFLDSFIRKKPSSKDFEGLAKDMTVEDIIKKVGNPHRIIMGSNPELYWKTQEGTTTVISLYNPKSYIERGDLTYYEFVYRNYLYLSQRNSWNFPEN